MRDVRVVLIGGTSNTGKSTVAGRLAERLGFEHRSTDGLARHPGRPWRTPEHEVPPHVAEHYATSAPDELLASVLAHYERLWPRIEGLITDRARPGSAGLVLEGSALLPERVARLTVPRTAAVWLTADDAVLRDRVRTAGRYARASEEERLLMDRFLARTHRFQTRTVEAVESLGLARLDVGGGRTVEELADAVMATAARPNRSGG
ncbi:AAA family ATPase [Streptomyces californicus]|uniref:AAA family ATPase n=1 Tax=Streptomyces californicus TaxID=67351 RepID=A0ABD7CZV0_9ACTN|nr:MULTISPECIES: AAA family ATPase [Streptomyces]QRV28268.1 AAA family ATPase [Streptomyces californicus]QRV36066.1 AAA family ATPase [Streptomyces californicus]QRV41667.1 AAA family ATPase [Streptomyces californicus]QRV48425.1 AAA family ATPase [Streptomyces californicus]